MNSNDVTPLMVAPTNEKPFSEKPCGGKDNSGRVQVIMTEVVVGDGVEITGAIGSRCIMNNNYTVPMYYFDSLFLYPSWSHSVLLLVQEDAEIETSL